MWRETYAVVDLGRIMHNVRRIREEIGPKTVLMASVKADGYGHGALQVSQAALRSGADRLGVATVGEAAALRDAGIGSPILVYGAPTPDGAKAAVDRGIELTVGSLDDLQNVEESARRSGGKALVHVKFDTGMGRLGVRGEDEALRVLAEADRSRDVTLCGVFTHFSSADEPRAEVPRLGRAGVPEAVSPGPADFTELQRERLERIVGRARAEGIEIPLVHAANSAAVFRGREHHYDMVRPGIALYGYDPVVGARPKPLGLLPALSVRAAVTRVADIAPGDPVSYGRTFTARQRERVATLGIGYGDGIPRSLSNRGRVRFAQGCAPIVGRVCMDQMMVLVTGLSVSVGDEAEVYTGDPAGGCGSISEAAEISDTITYELLCRLSARVPRFYRSAPPV